MVIGLPRLSPLTGKPSNASAELSFIRKCLGLTTTPRKLPTETAEPETRSP